MQGRSKHVLHTFMAQITDEMASEYARIYARAAEDPGTAGDEGEENWATLFRDWLPPNYHVRAKGRLIAHDGNMSPQIDIIVLKPSYPRKLLEKKIWLADGVIAAFECKTTLKAAHVTESVARCKMFKTLFRPRQGSPHQELRSPLIYGLLAHSHMWVGGQSTPLENVSRAHEAAIGNIECPRYLVDLICVADLATWSSMYIAYNPPLSQSETEAHKYETSKNEGGPVTAMMCASIGAARQEEVFRPVSALLSYVTQRIAWADANVRDIANYYRGAGMWGSASGPQRLWPISTYSEGVRAEIANGRLVNGGSWNEWSLSGM